MTKALIDIPHTVITGKEGADIALIEGTHTPFIKLMDSLYPQLVHGSSARTGKGYNAFLLNDDGTAKFIGSFTGMTLASVRKNPWFKDTGGYFLKALLGGAHADGHETHRSRCVASNYGTLRLWQKLGLGAKVSKRGDCISAANGEDEIGVLQGLINAAKAGYADIRASANIRIEQVENPDRFLPVYEEDKVSHFVKVLLD